MSTTATPKLTVWPAGSGARKLTLDAEVIAFQAQNAITSPTGSWSVTLLPGFGGPQRSGSAGRVSELIRLLQPQSVVSLGFDVRGGITMGLVRTVREAKVMRGNQVTVGVVVQGSTMGFTLTQATLVNARFSKADQDTAFYKALVSLVGEDSPIVGYVPVLLGPPSGNASDPTSTFLGATIPDVVDWILTRAPSMRLPLLKQAKGGDGTVGDYIDTTYCVTSWPGQRVYSDSLQHYQGTVWGFLQAAIDIDFYEVFLDTRPVDGAELPALDLVLRPKPYDDNVLRVMPVSDAIGVRWPDLKTRWKGKSQHQVELDQVLQLDLGWTSDDAFTWYTCTSSTDIAASPASIGTGLAFPAMDMWGVQKFDLRPMAATLNLLGPDVLKKIQGDEDYAQTMLTDTLEFRNRLVNWYRFNPFFTSGQITIRGKDEYRCGEPYWLPWATPRVGNEVGMRMYCTGTVHSWRLGGEYEVTLDLVRGYNRGSIDAAKQEIARGAPEDNPSQLIAVGLEDRSGR